MEEALVAILQFLFEFLIEVFSYDGLDWWPSSRSRSEADSVVLRCIFWFAGGCVLAWLSVLVFKHTLIHHSILRIANLLLAPPTSAYIAQSIALKRQARDPLIVPRHRFWQSFWFTLGLVAVRFAYAAR